MHPTLRCCQVIRDAAEVACREVQVYGQRIRYLEAGTDGHGPSLVLVHGLAAGATTWAGLLPLLGRHAHVLAPDLLGAGWPAKPREGDYSVGAHAARLRDLLDELRQPRASIIGHSYGGGVAMSFAYQFPERTTGIGLIASGGLGPELTVGLRDASLPGAALAASTLAAFSPPWVRDLARQTVVRAGLAPDDVEGLGHALRALRDRAVREAFLHTVRAAVDWSGQRLTAIDRLEMLAEMPALLIAGRRDSAIPYQHTVAAHQRLPTSRLQILDSGHFPHHDQPALVANLIIDVLANATTTVWQRPAPPVPAAS